MKKLIEILRNQPFEIQLAVYSALEVADKKWDEKDTIAYGTLARQGIKNIVETE